MYVCVSVGVYVYVGMYVYYTNFDHYAGSPHQKSIDSHFQLVNNAPNRTQRSHWSWLNTINLSSYAMLTCRYDISIFRVYIYPFSILANLVFNKTRNIHFISCQFNIELYLLAKDLSVYLSTIYSRNKRQIKSKASFNTIISNYEAEA